MAADGGWRSTSFLGITKKSSELLLQNITRQIIDELTRKHLIKRDVQLRRKYYPFI